MRRLAQHPLALIFLMAGCYIASVVWLKLERSHSRQKEILEQRQQISERLALARNMDSSLRKFAVDLQDQKRLHPTAPVDDLVRSLRTAMVQALPGVLSEIANPTTPVLATSAGFSLVPVSVALRIEDDTLIATLAIVEGLRPGFAITRLHARKSDTRRVGQPGNKPQLDVAISGQVLITANAGAKR